MRKGTHVHNEARAHCAEFTMLTPSPAAGGEDGGAIPASFCPSIIPDGGGFVNSFFARRPYDNNKSPLIFLPRAVDRKNRK